MARPSCVVIGAGGHARMVVDSLRASGAAVPVAALDADEKRRGSDVLGVRVEGGDERLPAMRKKGLRFVVGVGGVGDNGPRRAVFDKALAAGLRPLRVVHPSAAVSKTASIGDGCVILPRAAVNAGAVLGANVIVNTGAIVEHDCRIGDHAHVATGAVLCGGVTVGASAHIGAGAVVKQGVSIGERAVIGAGAVVLGDVRAGAVVAGVPAKPLR